MTGTRQQPPDRPDVVVLPPVLVAGAVCLGLLLDRLAPLGDAGWAWPWRAAGLVPASAGVALALWGHRRFERHGTNTLPTRPAIAIVTDGPYAFTRNPIYVGLAAFQAGVGLLAASPWTLLLLVPVVATLDLGVVRREERYLERKFGEAYRVYRRRVRRWL